jgi:phage shock protein A
MSIPAAKEYIAHYITSLKLTEKKRQDLESELTKWTSRIQLARSKGAEDLALEAEKEAEKVKSQYDQLGAEIEELKIQIESMRKQLPGLRARERTIDPDLLEQELIMATGYMPGETEKIETERRLKDMGKASSAEAALAALKAKMGLTSAEDVSSAAPRPKAGA